MCVALAACCLVAVPLGVGVYTHDRAISEWDLYKIDANAMTVVFAHREAALVLAERASRLQASRGEDIRYRWTERSGSPPAGFVETRQGYLPLETQTFGTYQGRELSVGLVQNDLGAVVMHMTNVARGECTLIHYWMGDYTKSRATGALLPYPMSPGDEGKALREAHWEPLASAVERCKAGEYGKPRTLLVRFDGVASDPGGEAR